ncbi:MAG TPA: YCF48-related protein [Solirubrobacteraceae bacterium]|nr:YCF48-related protein [Solirubrobacteraceae bacterium]
MSIKRLGLRSVAVTAALVSLYAGASAASVRVPLSGWDWGNPAPQGNALGAIDFQLGRGYAVGAAGTALRTDDGGTTWSGLATGTAADLARLQIIDPETVTILGADGCVLRRTDDGGKTFHKIFIVAETDCPDRVRSSYFVDKTTGYLLLADGSVLRTTDAGQSFSKQTAIPGTQASATPGGAVAKEIVFNSADAGIAFVSPGGPEPSVAYFTTDAGISWKPLTIPAGDVERVYRFDANTLYATGAETLMRSTDAGLTWTKQAFGAGLTLTSIGCADALTCLITTSKGELDRTTDGGATATTITASSVPLFGAAFANPTRAVAVGSAGQTVVSDDAGVNYLPVGGDVGGQFSRVRRGPVPSSAFAPGAKGQLALTADGGVTWKVANVSTSADLIDTSWPDLKTGYALDVRGGLFRTQNSGLTWQTLSAGPGGAARAVVAIGGSDTVLLFGPRGIKKATGGGEFNAVAGKAVARAALGDAQLAGSAVFAWGPKALLASTDKGTTWKAIKLPTKKTRVRQAAFASRAAGFLLDASGRVWRTANGGRTWSQSFSAGTARITGMTFGSATSGYLSVGGFGADSANAYVLHTTDAGRSWRPQAVATGVIAPLGIVASDALHAFTLVQPNGTPLARRFFFTATGGDAGAASPLKIRATPAKFTKRSLKRTRGRVTITGTLGGAIGGEQITVSARAVNGVDWTSKTVTAGANGGSFSATFNVKNAAVFVAQWAGDSGRIGEGTPPLLVTVTK